MNVEEKFELKNNTTRHLENIENIKSCLTTEEKKVNNQNNIDYFNNYNYNYDGKNLFLSEFKIITITSKKI